jgi:hypothetical protein
MVRIAHAKCRCACVNGQVTPLCSSTRDMPSICSPQICPLVPPSIPPMTSPSLPPLGTTSCSMEEVYNKYTFQYEYRRICR